MGQTRYVYPYSLLDIVAYVHQFFVPDRRERLGADQILALAEQLGMHRFERRATKNVWCRAVPPASGKKATAGGAFAYSQAARDSIRFNLRTALAMGWDLELPHFPFPRLLTDLECLTAESQVRHQIESLHDGMAHTYLSHE